MKLEELFIREDATILQTMKQLDETGQRILFIAPAGRLQAVLTDGDAGDQVRITTPARAREIGSDFIVVGRPITAAADPVAAYRRCVAEFVGEMR